MRIDIKRLGFKCWGKFQLKERKLAFNGKFPNVPGVYVFTINLRPMYIGKSRNPAAWRLKDHVSWERRGGVKWITDALRARKVVEYYFLPEPKVLWTGIEIEGQDSVEQYLIKELNPPWNRDVPKRKPSP